MGIEASWKKKPLHETLTVDDDEWENAEAVLGGLLLEGKSPPFKIDRKKYNLNHSFLVVPGEDGEEPRIAAMARGKYVDEGILGHGAYGVVKLIQWKSGLCDAVKIESSLNESTEEEQILKKMGQHITTYVRQRGKKTPWIENKEIKDKKYTLLSQAKGNELENYLAGIDFFGLEQDGRVAVALGAAKAIQQVHRNRIVHGDIKPANFKIDTRGDVVAVTAVDFGFSKVIPEGQTYIKGEFASGSPKYIAPEIAELIVEDNEYVLKSDKRIYSLAADIYALGVMFKDDLKIYEGSYKPLIEQMTAKDYKQRPTISEVSWYLQHIDMYHAVSNIKKYEKQKRNSGWSPRFFGMSSNKQCAMAVEMDHVLKQFAEDSSDLDGSALKVLAILKNNQDRHAKTTFARASRFNLKVIQDLPPPLQIKVCEKLNIAAESDLLKTMSYANRKALAQTISHYEPPTIRVQLTDMG